MKLKKKIINYINYNRAKLNLHYRKKLAKSHLRERQCFKPLDASQKKDILDFWEKVSGSKKIHFDFKWYEVYNGVCEDPSKLKYYIPNDFYYCYIDHFFADEHYCRKFDDKTLYELYFPEVRHPETIVRRSGDCLLDSHYQIINIEKAINLCHDAGSIIFKPAVIENGGKKIKFWSLGEDEQVLRSLLQSKDFVIQKILRQHEVLNNIHAQSINTIRILTLLYNGEVKVLSSILRMGSNGKRVDNGSSGGLFCGILPDGHLRPKGYDFSGIGHEYHPQGTRFSDVVIPNFPRICELAKVMAPRFQNLTRLISWDFSIGEDGEPVLVESNLSYGGCNVHQLSNGPILGEMTEEILQYVFKNNPMLNH